MEKHEHGSISATDIHPVLAEIPPKLWAKHKYDVGLIKGCEPVVITPMSIAISPEEGGIERDTAGF